MTTPATPGQAAPGQLTAGQLVLADGSVFEGELIGARAPIAAGEVVFNTVLSGYQEVLTDPSYAGQIITFTYPHIGNYGVNATDFESIGPFCRGVVIRDPEGREVVRAEPRRSEEGMAGDPFVGLHRYHAELPVGAKSTWTNNGTITAGNSPGSMVYNTDIMAEAGIDKVPETWDELLDASRKAKDAGKMRLEGKEYVVSDGDVMHFRFAT